MSFFRSLLAAAMGDDELPSNVEAYEQAVAASGLTYDPDESSNEGKGDDSDDAFEPQYSEDDEDEDSDVERHLFGKRKRRRAKSAGRRRKRTTVKRIVVPKVPPELAGVLGEANMLYASHQYNEAISLLKEFIKKAPTIPDPYHTLGMIYEDRQDHTKALQFFLIACTLTPQDADLWKRVGRMAKEENNMDQALFCFKKATQADTKDQEALCNYIELCRERGDQRRVADSLKKLANLRSEDLELWIQVAEAYHGIEQPDEAVDALKMCIERASMQPLQPQNESAKFELNAVNMLADLFIEMKKYHVAIQAIHALHGRFAAANSLQSETQIETVDGDLGGLPLDIAVKYGICHLFEHDFSTAEAMFDHLFAQDIQVFGDLYLDVAEAYIALGNQDARAAEILSHLLGREEFPMDQIWAKYAQCHDRQEIYDIAADSYEKALYLQRDMENTSVDPDLLLRAMQVTRALKQPEWGLRLLEDCLPEVMRPPIRPYWRGNSHRRLLQRSDETQKRKKLTFTQNTGDNTEDNDGDSDYVDSENYDEEDEAEDADGMRLPQDPSLSVNAMENGIRLKLLTEWGHLKKATGDSDALCQVGIPIILTSLSQTSVRLSVQVNATTETAKKMVRNTETQSAGFQVLKSEYLVDISDPTQRDSLMGIVMRVAQQVVIARVLGEQAFYRLVIDVAQTLTELGKYVVAIELLTDVNSSNKISDKDLRFELRFVALVIALEFKENRMAYECARLNIMENPRHAGYWNLFARVIAITGAYSWHQKFLAKVLKDDPNNYPAIVLAGHRSAVWDIASLTVGELTVAHQRYPTDPLIIFCLGLSFLSASMQRTINDRQITVAKAFAFLQSYGRVRILPENLECCGIAKDFLELETWYNMGRAHQQLGLFHLAIPMYERVLRFFELGKMEKNDIPPEYLICRETAYNLSLIYKKSGAHDLARYLIAKYLTLE